MGDAYQLQFVDRHKSEFRGPFLEVGSHDYGSTQSLRTLFPGESYLGVDANPGDGVDTPLDMTADLEEIDRLLEGRRFGTVFCLSVLEHCQQPFVMAERITQLLEPGGKACISVPFSWVFHAYPSDFWRFTHEGVKVLFPKLDFDHPGNRLSVHFPDQPDSLGEEYPLDKNLGRLKLSGASLRKRGFWWRGLSMDLINVAAALGPLRWLGRYRMVLPMCLINMIGTLRE